MPVRFNSIVRCKAAVAGFARRLSATRIRRRPKSKEDMSIAPTNTYTPSTERLPDADLHVGCAPLRHPSQFSLRKSSRRCTSSALIKDALLVSLEGLAESADAFPPLKSAIGGLLYLTKQIDLVSNNQSQIEAIYAQINSFTASLAHAVSDATSLSHVHKDAIRALAGDIRDIKVEGKHPIVRFLRAKRHSGDLQDLSRQLDQADASFRRTLLSSTETKCTRILDCVETIHCLQTEIRELSRCRSHIFFFLIAR
ncbi:unnamed protein product [Peniophora sp. CBMAI 1063]|nr:unnamed protein product [Peniophora sp. CBMAI 1063]